MQRTGSRALREIGILGLLYAAYSVVRNMLGEDAGLADRNARRILDLEGDLGILVEATIQRWLDHTLLMQTLNMFYGLAHFLVTGGVLIWLFMRRPEYVRWRDAIVVTTGLALVGYATFPLMPPRLVDGDGIVDSLVVHGGPWNYQSAAMEKLTNQFAAMPSLHVAWALWCTATVFRLARRPAIRAAAIVYSGVAVLTVVATGNHYVLDVVGGAFVFIVAMAITGAVDRRRRRRSSPGPRSEPTVTAEPAASAAAETTALDPADRVLVPGSRG